MHQYHQPPRFVPVCQGLTLCAEARTVLVSQQFYDDCEDALAEGRPDEDPMTAAELSAAVLCYLRDHHGIRGRWSVVIVDSLPPWTGGDAA